MPTPNGNGRLLPILSFILSVLVAGIGMPVGKCFYDELKSVEETQSNLGHMLAGFGKRLEFVEANSQHVFELRLEMIELRGDIKRIGDAAGVNLSSRMEIDPLAGQGG